MNFKIFLAILIYSMLTSFVICQTSFEPFKSIDFNEGGYRLVGKFTTLRNEPFSSEVGSFYIDDISTLEKIQKNWIFQKPGNYFACGYHYNLVLTKNGKTIQTFSINLECHEIAFGPAFYFKPILLTDLKDKMNYLAIQEIEITNRQEMKKACDNLVDSGKLIFIELPDWYLYEGTFQYQIEEKLAEDFQEQFLIEYNLEIAIKEKINKLYPVEPISVSVYDDGEKTFVEIKSNRLVYDYFLSMKNISEFKPIKLNLERIHYATHK